MSKQRRNFSAKFKSDLVIELLKGEKDLNTLAVENNIQPNLLRNWKKEFLDNAFAVFDDKREDNLKEKLAEERKEKAEYAKKVGQLTMQVDWLKKNLKKFVDLTTRVSLVQNLLTTKEIPASVGAKLLDINRTSIYYKGTPVSDEELTCKEIIDHLHTDNPAWGARQMSAQLKSRGYHVGRRKARRYMNEMDIYPIYPKMNLSKRMQQAKVCPYLLRNATILCLSFFVCRCISYMHSCINLCNCGLFQRYFVVFTLDVKQELLIFGKFVSDICVCEKSG